MSAQPTEGTTPRPWFWNSYSAIFSAPMSEEYNRLEALIPADAPESAYADLPETVVCSVPHKHGDTATKRGAADATLIVAAVNDYDRLLAVEAAALEWRDSEDIVRGNPAPTRKQWDRALAAREALRAALARPAEEERG